MLFVLDGDIDTNKEDKEAKIKKILTGDTDFAYTQRENVLNKIKQFILPPNIKPEKYYHQLICKLDERILGDEQKGIQKVAKRIENTDDSHKYFNLVIQEMGLNKEVGLNKLVDMLAETPEWKIITEEIDSWLESKKSLIIENIEQTKESIELTKD